MNWPDLNAITTPHGFCLAQYDPRLIGLFYAGNVMTAMAYVVGFPFACFRLLDGTPHKLMAMVVLGVAFVAACGVGHLFDAVVIRTASYNIYFMQGVETLITGLISWAFVLAVFWATQRAGLRVVADE